MDKNLDRINYGESVKINIGDYESREFHFSLSTDIEKDEKFDVAVKRLMKKVKMVVHSQEKKIRNASRDHVDFETMEKL